MKRFTNIIRFPRPAFLRAKDGLRAAVERAPEAEALAASWMERARPLAMRVYTLRRRIATAAVGVLAVSLLVHVMFGANGMVAYRQKRAAYETLRKQIERAQQENERYTQQIQGLKSDEKAIEKEAREQLGYAKPGEYVYVATPPAKPAPPLDHSHSAKK
ncbi:MAG TPA: septum formation initiator family protein [Candidatus Sulfotelmatobacter sp.]|nr:septum formation initiator family protein [Candidatus Sulfotelmatobacter sp.]